MDIATIGGLITGLGLVAIGIIVSEGVKGFTAFWHSPGFLITYGGNFAALMVNYPLKMVLNIVKVLKQVLKENTVDTAEIISVFVNYSKKARTDGFLALANDVKQLKNDFLKRGIQLVIDGADQEFIRSLMETELTFIRERHKVGQEMFYALGTYSPAWGIIGTVIGLILMLKKLEDPSTIASAMAIALLTAFYGLTGGYLLFNPIGGKLVRKSEEELFIKEVIVKGVLLLQSNAAPSIIESNLKAYLEPKARQLGIRGRKMAGEGK